MASTEPARHSLYSRLEEVLGSEHAETLMTYLPRYQADEFATKADIARLEDRFDRLETRIDGLEGRFDQLQRTVIVAMVGSMTALTAIFSLVVAFLA